MSADGDRLVLQATAVAIEGRALLIEGEPGTGKSSLALALIERGAQLIGDDSVTLTCTVPPPKIVLVATPPPNIEGLIEVHGVGLARMPVADATPVGLILTLQGPGDPETERLPEETLTREILGCRIPALPFRPGEIAPAMRAHQALKLHGLN